MEDQKFKVGERVWFQPLGWGVVDRIGKGGVFSVRACFGDSYFVPFTDAGEYKEDSGIQSLFRANSGVLKFDTTELPVWPKNHPIWVRDSSNSRWVKRHLSHLESGFAFCFADGSSEHTARPGGRVKGWSEYTDVDPNKE